MFGPANQSCLPGNGWEKPSPPVSQSRPRWLGGGPPTAGFLTGVNKGPFSLEKTPHHHHQLHPCQGWGTSKVQARVSLEALPGPLSWPPQL